MINRKSFGIFMGERDLRKRTRDFANCCVRLCEALPDTILGRHVNRQLIRSSTSVHANYRAVCLAQSKAHFVSKISIVIEEVDESCYWLEFIIEHKLLSEKQVGNLLKEGQELTGIFIKSRMTAKNRQKEFVNCNESCY